MWHLSTASNSRSFHTPFGSMIAIFKNGSLAGLRFGSCLSSPEPLASEDEKAFQETVSHIESYCQRKISPPPPLALTGTEFQKKIWELLLEIPAGATISYGNLARLYCERFSQPRLCTRAAAHAVAKNPVWVIIPCHRVILANGSPGNYGGGSELKKLLLEHESQFPGQRSAPLNPCKGQAQPQP